VFKGTPGLLVLPACKEFKVKQAFKETPGWLELLVCRAIPESLVRPACKEPRAYRAKQACKARLV
jgi:hypothetical protein